MRVDDVADELYGLLPAEFMAARQQRVASARANKDRDLAKAISGLRKPTVSAWAMNQLVRQAPDEVEALLELGAALRRAQHTVDAAELRALSARRQTVVRDLTTRIQAIARALGLELGEPVLRDIGQSLKAAIADPAVATQLRAGRMAAGAEYSGFGLTGLEAVPDQPEPELSTARQSPSDEAALRAAAAELAGARTALERASELVQTAAEQLAGVEARIVELRHQLGLAEQERRFRATAHQTALADAAAADDRRRAAEQRLADLDGASTR